MSKASRRKFHDKHYKKSFWKEMWDYLAWFFYGGEQG